MNIEEIEFIEACTELHNKPLYYYKDRYAMSMLQWILEDQEQADIADLKRGSIGPLLNKPIFRPYLARAGKGALSAAEFQEDWQSGTLSVFRLGLRRWRGGRTNAGRNWGQTSRPGFNTVLQINFGQEHDNAYKELLKLEEDHRPFVRPGHPVDRFLNTLAWARLDIDLDAGEALIEEIQCDWIRDAERFFREVQTRLNAEKNIQGPGGGKIRCKRNSRLEAYQHRVLDPYRKMWAEATLYAAIWFLREELGIRRIFYHTYETGKALKECDPLRSLYTDLPRRFCFRETAEPPVFLRREKTLKHFWRQHADEARFYLLEV